MVRTINRAEASANTAHTVLPDSLIDLRGKYNFIKINLFTATSVNSLLFVSARTLTISSKSFATILSFFSMIPLSGSTRPPATTFSENWMSPSLTPPDGASLPLSSKRDGRMCPEDFNLETNAKVAMIVCGVKTIC